MPTSFAPCSLSLFNEEAMSNQRRIVRLTHDYAVKPFDCGNDDLNDFLMNDAKAYADHLLAVGDIFA